MRRVVVTGMGLLTPLGYGLSHNWKALISGASGIRRVNHFDISDMPCQVAGVIPLVKDGISREMGGFAEEDILSAKEARRVDHFIIYGMAAAEEAIRDSGYVPQNDEQRERTGVMVGSGIGGLETITQGMITMRDHGLKKISPFYIPSLLINMASGHISIRHGYRGPNHAVVTACSTGAHAIGDASRLIQFGDADVMIAGGAESAVCLMGMAGFCASRALSTHYNDAPQKASRPWDKNRDGFVMGEGAGVLVLEELEHAKKRGARIYGEIVGYGLSGDAHHITAPAEDGNGGMRAMKAAMQRAELNPGDVGYLNAHGTSTPVGDVIEARAIKSYFGEHLKGLLVSSTKSSIGHLLGGAGSVEAIYSLMAMNTGIIPPTLNLDDVEEECKGIDFVPHIAREKKVNAVVSNSFGFGGTNASLVFKALE